MAHYVAQVVVKAAGTGLCPVEHLFNALEPRGFVRQFANLGKLLLQPDAAVQRRVDVVEVRTALHPDGYPFILKAAHEEAVVTKEDQREIEAALEQALLERGIQPRTSPKQSAKDSR